MTNEITVTIKCVYGNELIYPVCDHAKLFAELAGKKTLTRRDLNTVKKLGYEINVRSPDFLI